MRHAVLLVFAFGACATGRSTAVDPLAPGALASVYDELRDARRSPTEEAIYARVASALGHEDVALEALLAAAERSPALVPWARQSLLALVDHSDATPAFLKRVRAVPELAAVAEVLALQLQDAAALAEARARLGTTFSWRRSGRLLRYPGATRSEPLARARFDEPRPSVAGFIASPEEGPGLYVFELAAAPGAYRLEVVSDAAIRVFVGDRRLVAHESLEALLPDRVSVDLDLARDEPVQIHLVSRTAVAEARVLLHPRRDEPAPPRHGLAALAAFELALARRDFDVAAAVAAELPQASPFAALARARLAVEDPSRAPERARVAAKAGLTAAIEREPGFVEARALLTRLQSEDQDVLALALSDPQAAVREAEAAFARSPRSCRARNDWLDAAWERLHFHTADVVATFAEPLSPLPGLCLEARLRAVELLREAYDLAGAERVLAPLVAVGGLDPGPPLARAEVLAARLALARGDWGAAAAHARAALLAGGVDTFAKELVARAERLRGGPAAPRVDPARDVGLPLSDARELIRAHLRKRATTHTSREVLLDDRHVRVQADGDLRVRVHHLVRVNDVAAVESIGELPIPDDAEVLFVRTWKHEPRGPRALRSLEPEDILEKATVSLPNLAPGDFAEWAYFYPLAASPRLAPGWRAPEQRFDSGEGPVALARYTISLAPGARPPVFIVDPRVPPAARPDDRTWVFVAKDLERVFGEPLDPRPDAAHLTLLASSEIERLPLADALAAEIAFATRSTPVLGELVADVARGLPESAGDDALLQALYDRVRRTIDEPDDASPFVVEASWIAERGRGSRALLLAALCRAAGLACELVLARPLWEGPEPAHVDLDGLTYPLVRWAPVGQPARWLDPASRFMPYGLLPPALEGVYALSLGAAPPPSAGDARRVPPATLETPPAAPSPTGDPAHWGERKVSMKITFDATGGALAEGEEAIDGVFAASWRVALVALAPEAREKILGSIVQQALPAATIESVTLEHLEDDARPLVWRWRARTNTQSGANAAVPEARSRTLSIALFPEGLTNDTVLLAERTTPLLVNRAARMSLTLTLVAPEGWTFPLAPSDLDVTSDLGRLERRSRFEELGRVVVVDKRFVLRPGVVEPARYAAWSAAAVAIDRADIIEAVLAPPAKRGLR